MPNPTFSILQTQFSGSQWPRFDDGVIAADSARLALYIEPGISWFAGHFPEHAVLPGVVQLNWARALGTFLFAPAGQFAEVQNLKFQTMILPSTAIFLELEFSSAKNSVAFWYRGEPGTAYSQGKLVYRQAESA